MAGGAKLMVVPPASRCAEVGASSRALCGGWEVGGVPSQSGGGGGMVGASGEIRDFWVCVGDLNHHDGLYC